MAMAGENVETHINEALVSSLASRTGRWFTFMWRWISSLELKENSNVSIMAQRCTSIDDGVEAEKRPRPVGKITGSAIPLAAQTPIAGRYSRNMGLRPP